MRLYRLILILILGTITLTHFAPVSAEWSTSSVNHGCTPVQPLGWVVYSIQPGDTLSDLAANTGSTIDELTRANCVWDSGRIVVDQRLFIPHLPEPTSGPFVRRCLNAGFTTQECRRIYNSLHDSDSQHFIERCLNAGYTTEQCRRIYNAWFQDDNTVAEHCRDAELAPEQCRRFINADPDRDIAARCRAAELTPEQCRRVVRSNSDRTIDLPQSDQVRPGAGLQEQEPAQPSEIRTGR